ncbi:uncharacterized protein LOC124854643 [Hippoglossus stenolepis]|uniref:uncharacterized protein LOC124854643 n=1 Tax=Hippoglossus stenolepis TaxID=195615 RepID=UPI001FAFE64C|nr:uncharacterized protein LOC124854643 [Hippoglossus stenolepis]
MCVCEDRCERMSVFLLILCVALLQQEGRARPEPPGCSSPEAVRVAGEALEQINQDGAHGYVLSLNRVYDVSHSTETNYGSLYRLTVDVLETTCHISSRKPWKQCEVRGVSEVPAAAVEEQVRARADSKHTGHQHHNHTHLHPHEHEHEHEHEHAVTPSPDATVPKPRGSLGTVVNKPAVPRSAPAASSCPGPRRHNRDMFLVKL